MKYLLGDFGFCAQEPSCDFGHDEHPRFYDKETTPTNGFMNKPNLPAEFAKLRGGGAAQAAKKTQAKEYSQ